MSENSGFEISSVVLISTITLLGFLGGLWLLYWYEGPLENLGLFLTLAAAVVGIAFSRGFLSAGQ